MALGSERYLTPNIYICKDRYYPKGICYGNKCSSTGLTVTEKDITETVSMYVGGRKIADITSITARQINIRVNLSPAGGTARRITAYLLPNGSGEECMLASPPCREIDTDSGVKWYEDGDFITAELPLAEHCAVNKFQTTYSSGTIRTDTPTSIGEADGESVTLTFDDGGKTLHKTSISEKYLIPGKETAVHYGLRGVDGYHYLAIIDFQTEIFTSAEFAGCGLVKREKVYKNPSRPELDYTYEYVPYAGGIGKTIRKEWSYDTNYRICVAFRGKHYWIKSTDHAPYEIGQRVFIMKGTSDMPLIPDESSSRNASDTLSEYDDVAVPEHFYSGVN
ncbi:MAG: hypothetical protein AB7E76_10765 [Deferribacterales bacterium]